MRKLFTALTAIALGIGICAAAPPQLKRIGLKGQEAPSRKSATETRADLVRRINLPTAGQSRSMLPNGGIRTAGVAGLFGNMKKETPSKVGPNGGTVYGWLNYTDSDDAYDMMGFNELTVDGGLTTLFPTPMTPNWGDLLPFVMYVRQGDVVCLGWDYDSMWGDIYGNCYAVYTLDGKKKTFESLPDTEPMMTLGAYDPVGDVVYGYIEASDGVVFVKAPGDNPRQLTVIATFGNEYTLNALTYNTPQRKLIGITHPANGNKAVEISVTTGEQTELATVEQSSIYACGLAYSPFDGGYFYTYSDSNGSGLQLLDENSFKSLRDTKYPTHENFTALYSPDLKKISPSAPAAPVFVSKNFVDGSTSGTLTYRLASANFGGTPLLGDMDWELYIDDKFYKRGSGAAGSEATIAVEGLTDGFHTFTFFTSLAGNYSMEDVQTLYIGNDTPKAPTNVTLTATEISWDSVTEGANNAYVNPEAITYNVYLNGKQIASEIKSTTCASGLTADTPLDTYVAAVEAVFAGHVSEQGLSREILYGEPMTLPVSLAPAENEVKLFTIVDANNDNRGISFTDWKFGDNTISAFCNLFGISKQSDDWLFLPPISFNDKDAIYNFAMNAFRNADNYTEQFEVKLCSAPDPSAVVSEIAPATTVNNANNYEAAIASIFNFAFRVPEAKDYYIGIHVVSNKQFRLFMRDFNVSLLEGVKASNPAAPTALSATGAAEGKLSATATFTMPTTTIDGTPYAADKKLKAVVAAAGCEATTVEGVAGAELSAEIATKQGDNAVSVTVYDGDNKGLSADTRVYIGVDVAGTVTNLKAVVSEDNMSLHITWDAPEVGANGGYNAPSGYDYYLCVPNGNSWVVSDLIGLDVKEVDLSIPEGSQLGNYGAGILAVNVAGTNNNIVICSAVMGKPYDLPAVSSYVADNTLSPVLNMTPSSTSLNLYIGDPGSRFSQFATPDKANAIFSYSTANVENALLSLPKFSTATATKPAVELTTFGGSCESISVYASCYGSERELIKTIAGTDMVAGADSKLVVELPAKYASKQWVEVYVGFHTTGRTQSFILYSYRFFDNLDNDFAATAIQGPAIAEIGTEAQYKVTVANFSNKAAAAPSGKWTITDAEGNLLASRVDPADTETTPSFESIERVISFTPNANYNGEITIAYTLETADDNMTNNTVDKQIKVQSGVNPTVTDLHAEKTGYDNVTLAWTAPVSGPVVDSFEDLTPFVLDDKDSMLGQFKRYDGDGKYTYALGVGNQTVNIPGAGGPASFVVWSASQIDAIVGSTNVIPAKTGDKFLVAFCPAEPSDDPEAADDWLISPKVEGGTEVSFSMMPLTYRYGSEKIEIMYSTTNDNPASFKLLKSIETLRGGDTEAPVWEDYSVELPDDAVYFAIHYVSKDIYGIVIDDVAFTPAGSSLSITGYDVYRNGVRIADNASCPDNSYTDTGLLEATAYDYMVVPVLSDGSRGFESNVAHIVTTSVEGIAAPDNADVEYYNMQGIRVNGIPAPGVYIRKQGDKIEKVIIAK